MIKKPYFERALLEQLKKWVDRREIFAIKGPRQSGKTTLLKMLQDWLKQEKKIKPENIIFITFEDRDILEKFSKDPKEYVKNLAGKKENEKFYFFVDEFQYLENGGQILKLLYDTNENIKFIITGSSSLELTGKTARFLVGRVFSFYLWQLNFQEFLKIKSEQLYNAYKDRNEKFKTFIVKGEYFDVPSEDIFENDFKKMFEEYTVWGGYPEVVKSEDEETKKMVLKNIYDTYITRDIIEMLKITDYSSFKKIVTLLAGQIGNLLNYENLATDAKSYYKETKNYLSILEQTFIISLIKPFYRNKTTELKKNPKNYFIDLGLRNYILGNFQEFSLKTDKGPLVENAAFLQFKFKEENEENAVKYWRTLSKAEVDFVLEQKNEVIPVEIKYSNFKHPEISRSFRSFLNQYKPRKALMLTNGFIGEMKMSDVLIKFVPVWYL